MTVPIVRIKPENVSRLGQIKSVSASNMKLDEVMALTRWASGWFALFRYLTLQEILNVYRIYIDSGYGEFNDFRCSRHFVPAWNAVTEYKNRMI